MSNFTVAMIMGLLMWGVSGAVMNAQVCQEAVNKGYSLEHCWFNQKPEQPR
jgi:hypothetical protein